MKKIIEITNPGVYFLWMPKGGGAMVLMCIAWATGNFKQTDMQGIT